MEQYAESKPNTETDFEKLQEREQKVQEIVAEAYFTKPELIKGLMIENLALKWILVEKNIVSKAEFDQVARQCRKMIDESVRRQVDEWKKHNPREAVLFDILAGKDSKDRMGSVAQVQTDSAHPPESQSPGL